MARLQLTDLQRAEIVRGLARFGTPTEVARAVGEEFGIELDRRQVWQYHPQNPKCGECWRKLYQEEREKFVASLDEQPVFHQAYRLHRIQRLLESARDPRFQADLLRQAAEEVGGKYTNVQKVSDPNGDPLSVLLASVDASNPTNLKDARKILRAMGVDG